MFSISVSLFCLKTDNNPMVSLMFKCPIVLFSSSHLPAIKNSFQNSVRTVHVPPPTSFHGPLQSIPLLTFPVCTNTGEQLTYLPSSVSSFWQALLTPPRCQGQRCSSESQLCHQTTNSSTFIDKWWHLCKRRKKFLLWIIDEIALKQNVVPY